MSKSNAAKKDLIDGISKINESLTVSDDSYTSFRNGWMKEFILSDLSRSDKIDILTYSHSILLKFKDIKKDKMDKRFFQLISYKKFHEAVKFCEIMAYEYPENRDHVKSLVKQRDIYLLSPKLEMEMGGLGHTIRHRANYLEENGYNVTIVNAGPIKNYQYILDYYHKTNGLSPNIRFYNLYEHYSKKNTFNDPVKSLDKDILNSKNDVVEHDGYEVKKTINTDNSLTLDFYNKESDKIKTEIYIDESLIYRETNEYTQYFTPDGFKYLERDNNTRKVYLNDRKSNATIEFNVLIRFLYHYLNEVCLESDKKPFIICDATTHWYNMNGVSLNDAYKIGSLHGNPFIDFDPNKELNPKVNHFKKIHLLDRVVLLTKEMKEDLKSRVDSNKLTVIPNFLLDEQLEYENVEKDFNTISVFSRIAPIKQLSHIIKAFKIVLDEKDNLKLNIYGTTSSQSEEEELEMLKNLTRELGIEGNVEFMGYTTDVASLMRKNLFTLLSSKMEGLPMSIIESMANSSPVISYDVKYGPKDIITNNVDGILIKENDIDGLAKSMLYLLDNPEIAIEMGRKAKEKVKNQYSIHSAGKMWEDMFIDLFIEKEINEYFESITLKKKYNKVKKDNKKLKDQIKNMKMEIEELKKTNETRSQEPGILKKLFKRK